MPARAAKGSRPSLGSASSRIGKFSASLGLCAPVAQLDRALDYESRGREFESLRARHKTILTCILFRDAIAWTTLWTTSSDFHYSDPVTLPFSLSTLRFEYA